MDGWYLRHNRAFNGRDELREATWLAGDYSSWMSLGIVRLEGTSHHFKSLTTSHHFTWHHFIIILSYTHHIFGVAVFDIDYRISELSASANTTPLSQSLMCQQIGHCVDAPRASREGSTIHCLVTDASSNSRRQRATGRNKGLLNLAYLTAILATGKRRLAPIYRRSDIVMAPVMSDNGISCPLITRSWHGMACRQTNLVVSQWHWKPVLRRFFSFN